MHTDARAWAPGSRFSLGCVRCSLECRLLGCRVQDFRFRFRVGLLSVGCQVDGEGLTLSLVVCYSSFVFSLSRKGLHFSDQTFTLYNINLNMEKNMENGKDIEPVFGLGVW